jgi:hypothetical protein
MSDATEDRERALDDAAEIVMAIKGIPSERRMDALAIACRLFCDTDGTMKMADA